MNNNETKKRNIYIDIMKGLLITLVVIGHLPYFEYDSRTLILIYSFHMHAFLIIGGMLSHINEDTKLSTILYKRIKGTLIPYFVFYLITFIIVPTTTEQKLNAIPVVIKGIGIPPDHALNLPLWFLTFYFVAMTVFEIIQFISYKIVGATHREPANRTDEFHELLHGLLKFAPTLLTLIFVSIIMRASFVYARIYKLPRLPYNIEIAGFCLGFVFLGNVLSKIVPHIVKLYNPTAVMATHCEPAATKNNIIIRIIITIISILALILITKTWYEYSMWNGRIDLNARDYKNAFYMYVDAILGFILFATFTYIMYIVSSFAKEKFNCILNNKTIVSKFVIVLHRIILFVIFLIDFPIKLFSYLGKNSLYILAFHVPSVFYSNAFIIPHLPLTIRETLNHNSPISILILTTFGIVFSLLCSLILKKILTSFKKLFNKKDK